MDFDNAGNYNTELRDGLVLRLTVGYHLNLTQPDQPPPRLEELKKKCGADL